MQSDLIIVPPLFSGAAAAAMTLAHPALASLRCLHFHFLLRFMSFRRRMPHTCHTTLLPAPRSWQLNSCPLPAPLARQRLRRAHLVSLLLCTAITYIQGTTYKIILYINNEERVHRSHNLPAEKEK